jgi:hypothetical protein
VFGGGQKITEYRYYANFAVAFGEGPCTGLLRLWAGEKLIADVEAPDLWAGGFAKRSLPAWVLDCFGPETPIWLTGH